MTTHMSDDEWRRRLADLESRLLTRTAADRATRKREWKKAYNAAYRKRHAEYFRGYGIAYRAVHGERLNAKARALNAQEKTRLAQLDWSRIEARLNRASAK